VGKQAIDGVRKNAFARDPKTLLIVGIDEIPGVDEPRKHPLCEDPSRLVIDDAMVRNIMHYGVIEPVVVTTDGGSVVVVDGRRRVLHAREANARLHERGQPEIAVTCIVRQGEEGDLMGVMVATNSVRLDETPLQKARKANAMLIRGMSEEQVALAFGVTTASVKAWQSLLSCAPEVIAAVETGKAPASVALSLSKLPKGRQAKTLDELLSAGGGKVKTKEAKAASKGDEKPGVVAPSKREIAAVLDHMKARVESEVKYGEFHELEEVIKALEWARGDRESYGAIAYALRTKKGAKS
jgi:ParB family chromosome partitioning protein